MKKKSQRQDNIVFNSIAHLFGLGKMCEGFSYRLINEWPKMEIQYGEKEEGNVASAHRQGFYNDSSCWPICPWVSWQPRWRENIVNGKRVFLFLFCF